MTPEDLTNVMMDEEDADGVEVDLTELLEDVINIALQSATGPLVGTVESYDAATNRASVVPAVPLLVEGEPLVPPKLPSVPVAWYGNATNSYKFPLVSGTTVQLAPEGHDHSGWFTTGAVAVPAVEDRRFSVSDLVAYPLAPTPVAAPPDPTSYSAAAAVLYGLHLVGSSAASKAVGLHGDQCPYSAAMATWMGQVEVFLNGLVLGTVSPVSSTFGSAGIASLTATATKLKAE